MCLECNQINGKLQRKRRDYQIDWVVENVGCLGLKTTKKEGKQGAKFA